MSTALFKEVIGQKNLIEEVSFYLGNYRATKVFPNSMLVAERGAGKSSLGENIGKVLKKPYHEMLAKDLTDADTFFEYVVIPLLSGKEATVFIDEASLLTPNITHSFLRILDTKSGHKTTYRWAKNNETYTFDFRKLTFIFATTNPQKVDPDLMDRLKVFTFDQYKTEDLARILQANTPTLTFEPSALLKFAETLRNNPRNAVHRANDLIGYARQHRKRKITEADYALISRKLNILPFGLNKMEAQALEFLSERPKTSLTTLAAKMHVTTEAVRREVETRLLATNLIEIDARGRRATQAGLDVLRAIKNLKKRK